jgi:hypothetical protein
VCKLIFLKTKYKQTAKKLKLLVIIFENMASTTQQQQQHHPYSDLQQNVHLAMNELVADESVYVPTREAEELFNLPDCVQIFFITADGRVSTFSQPSSLRIFKFKNKNEDEETNTFIQVNGWTHPLGEGSPVLKAGNGSFMFPDAYSDQEGASVGIVIMDDTPFNVDGEAEKQLQQLLDELTALKTIAIQSQTVVEKELELDNHLGKLGSLILKGAQTVGKTMEDTIVPKTTQLIEYATEKQKAKMGQPAEEDSKMNSVLKTTVKGAGYATKATVKVSGFVANRVGDLTKSIAKSLARKMEPAVSGATGAGGSGSGKAKNTSLRTLVDVARGGLLAYGTIYTSLEDSAKVLGTSVKSNSVQVVEHKYGGEAGEVFGEAATAAGNAAMTYMNIQSLGVKGLVKKTAKTTGKELGKAVLDAHSSKQPVA